MEQSGAVLATTPPDPDNGNALLATFRPADPSSRVEFKARGVAWPRRRTVASRRSRRLAAQLRAVEGQYGTLTAAVIAAVQPRTARLVSLPIKPLSLHHRCVSASLAAGAFPPDPDLPLRARVPATACTSLRRKRRPEWATRSPFRATLRFRKCTSGWDSSSRKSPTSTPPPRPPPVPRPLRSLGDASAVEESVTLQYRNAFLRSVLSVRYREGEAMVCSDSVSVVAIAKEVFTKQATERMVRVKHCPLVCARRGG